MNGNTFHDGVIQTLSVDFEKKQVTLVLRQGSGLNDGSSLITKLEFNGVEWQDFRDISSFNLIRGIEFTDNYLDYCAREQAYIEKKKNYFPKGTMENISARSDLKYYFLCSSWGMEGHIICSDLKVTENK